MDPKQQRASAIRFIVCLGVVSLFADVTYEGACSIIGPFLKDLGVTAAQVGLIAGLGEMLAASLRFFSGRFADRTHAYWTITIWGYALNLVAVPLLAFAGNWRMAALLVIAERTGKAVRGPARDVLLSEATNVVGHGQAGFLEVVTEQRKIHEATGQQSSGGHVDPEEVRQRLRSFGRRRSAARSVGCARRQERGEGQNRGDGEPQKSGAELVGASVCTPRSTRPAPC
jgi:hypothetical protein